MNTQMRFLMILSVILFLAVPIHAAESIITEGSNNTVTTDSDPTTGNTGSGSGTYSRNYGSGGGGGGYYRATPTPAITDMPMTVTTEEPLQSEVTPMPTVTTTPAIEPTETPITLPGFELLFAGLALFGIYAMRAKRT